MHDMFRYEKNRLWEMRLIRKALQIADLVVCPSSSVALDYVDRGWATADRTRVIRNGVDVDEFQPHLEGDAVVSIGRASSEKSHSDFESIANQLNSKHPTIRWILAGPASANLQNVECKGHQDDIRDVLKLAILYVSTSRTEGMSNALLESQAMGLPAVVRCLGSNSEIIRDGVNGFLAGELFDFVNKCDLLLSDSLLRKEMGNAARARMESEFAIGNQIRKIESIYRELL
jgi:glycosyltransferase involved in cell wall biosynthesis